MAGVLCNECAVPGMEQNLNNYHHHSVLGKGLGGFKHNFLFLGRLCFWCNVDFIMIMIDSIIAFL